MNDVMRKEVIRADLIKKNNGKTLIEAKYFLKPPDSAIREYIRMTSEYMSIEKNVIIKYLPELKKIINDGSRELNTDSSNDEKRKIARFENIDNTMIRLNILFYSIRKELDLSFSLYDLKRELKKLANLNHKLTVKEWKKTVSKTFGINLLDDYYTGSYYNEMLEEWISSNVDLIKTIPKKSLSKMKQKVYTDYMNGRTTTNIVKELQLQYGMDKRHANLIARDQTSKLNAAITKSQQKDAGVNKYKWSASRDGRVRKSHLKLNGNIYDWDDPPETDGGRRCHPGEDYECRCCAIPVFDLKTLELPV